MNNPLRYTDPSGWYVIAMRGQDLSGVYPDYLDRIYGSSGGGSFALGGGGGGGNFGLPGRGGNGVGLLGVYYDWKSETYRSNTHEYGEVGWDYAYNHSVIPTVIKEEQDSQLEQLADLHYKPKSNDNGLLAMLPPGKHGRVVSVFNGAAAYGLFGIMLDFGVVSDSYGQSSTYFTFGWMKGYGAAAGSGFLLTNTDLTLNNFAGWASGFMLQIPFTPVGLEGYTDVTHGAIEDHYGQSLKGFGANIGPGAIWGWYNSYTLLVPSLPNDFWTRPGRH
jgi:hypothetical protein